MNIRTRLSKLEGRLSGVDEVHPTAIIICGVELDAEGRRVSDPGFAIIPGTNEQIVRGSCESAESFLERIDKIQNSATTGSAT